MSHLIWSFCFNSKFKYILVYETSVLSDWFIETGIGGLSLPKNTDEYGYIESLYNLNNFDNQRRPIKIIPENQKIHVSFSIVKDSTEIDYNLYAPIYNFNDVKFKSGGINEKLYKFYDEKSKIYDGITISYSKMDSLNKHVFPVLRRKLISLYNDSYKDVNVDSRLKIEVLNHILRGFPFNSIELISAEQKEKINLFFDNINKRPDINSFNNLQEKINEINGVKPQEIEFVDFTLEDVNLNKVLLSDVTDKNYYSVLYFWTAGCSPCRSFNRKVKSVSKQLEENSIELIHISVDLSRDYWTKATRQDSIFGQICMLAKT